MLLVSVGEDYDFWAGLGKVKNDSFPMIYVNSCTSLRRLGSKYSQMSLGLGLNAIGMSEKVPERNGYRRCRGNSSQGAATSVPYCPNSQLDDFEQAEARRCVRAASVLESSIGYSFHSRLHCWDDVFDRVFD